MNSKKYILVNANCGTTKQKIIIADITTNTDNFSCEHFKYKGTIIHPTNVESLKPFRAGAYNYFYHFEFVRGEKIYLAKTLFFNDTCDIICSNDRIEEIVKLNFIDLL